MLDYLIQDNNLMPILAALGGINAQVSFSQFCLSVDILGFLDLRFFVNKN